MEERPSAALVKEWVGRTEVRASLVRAWLLVGSMWGCAGEEPLPVDTRALESPSAAERWEAIQEAMRGDYFAPERLLVDMMKSDPSPENRLRAAELLQDKATRKEELVNFGASALFDPDLRVRIAAARGLAQVPTEGGLVEVVRMAVGTLHELDAGVDGHAFRVVALERPRESMGILLTHFADKTSENDEGLGEAAVELAAALIEKDPALKSEPAVREWLENYEARGRSERTRGLASGALEGGAR